MSEAAPLTYRALMQISADARAGVGIDARRTRQLLSLIRRLQDRIAHSEPLLDWLHATGFSVLFCDSGQWHVGRPEGPALACDVRLHAALERARSRWQAFEDTTERDIERADRAGLFS